MNGRVGPAVVDGVGNPVSSRDLSVDEWADLLDVAWAAADGGGVSPGMVAYLLEELRFSMVVPGSYFNEVERLPCVEGGVDVLVLGEVVDAAVVPDARLHFCTSALGVETAESAASAERESAAVADVAERESAEVQSADQGWPAIRPLDPGVVPNAPLNALPGPFRAMVEGVSESAQVDAGLPLTFGLAVLSAAIGPASVAVRTGWVEPVGLFIGVVAGPGEGKSPALSAMAAPLYAIEREVQASSAGDVAVLAAEYDVRRRRVDEAKARAGKAKDDATRAECDAEVENAARNLADASPPEPRRLVVSDVTPERAAAIAAGMGGRLALLSDEPDILGPWLGRYSGGQASLGLLLSGWSASPVTIDRKSGAPVRIDRPALTVGLAFQPSFLAGLSADGRVEGRGLLERFLACWPPSRLGRRAADAPGLDDDARAGWDAMVRGAFQKFPEPSLSATAAGSVELRLSAEASAARAELHDRLEPRMGPGGDLHPIAGMAAKATGQGVRLAGVLHIAQHGLDAAAVTPISGATMRAGAVLAEYFVEHARIGLGRAGSRDGVVVILEWVTAKGIDRFSMRDLVTARHGTVESWLPHLQRLTDHGYIRPVEGGNTNSRLYEVNPAVISKDA